MAAAPAVPAQVSAAPLSAAAPAAVSAPPAPEAVAAAAVSAAPVPPPPAGFAPVAVPLAALTPKLDPVADAAPAAPATAMDSLPTRQFSVRLTPSMLWLPVAALLGYLILTNLPESPAAREAASAHNAVGPGAADQRAPDPHGGEDGEDEGPGVDAPGDGTDDGAAPAPPEASPARPPALTREQRKKLELAQARSRLKVSMYYTDWCQNCLEARGYLAGRGIRVESLDIEKDPKARARHKKLNPKGSVPTIVVEGKVLVGFSTQRLDKAIDRAARARVAKSSK